ncbi:MAG: pilus assembly protein N-terminal domain-containing protein [Rhodospirillaceae bacterium]
MFSVRRAAAVAAFVTIGFICTAPAPGRAGPAVKSPAIRVIINDVRLLETAGDIRTVLIGNPDVADASVAAPRRMVLMGKKLGVTSLLIIGDDGVEILRTSIQVAPQDEGVVTLDRGLKQSNWACSPRCVEMEPGKDGSSAAANAELKARTPPPIVTKQETIVKDERTPTPEKK